VIEKEWQIKFEEVNNNEVARKLNEKEVFEEYTKIKRKRNFPSFIIYF
jgi:hypothetical protein